MKRDQLLDRLKPLLLESKEAYIFDEEFVLSARVTGWLYEALCRQIGPEPAAKKLHSLGDGDMLIWFVERLDFVAIEKLISILEGRNRIAA